jgi:diguanylate cyclase (GGDEF)-like protein
MPTSSRRPIATPRSIRRGPRIATKFALVLALLIPSVLVVAWVGLSAERSASAAAERMYSESVVDSQHTARLHGDVSRAGWTALELMSASHADEVSRLTATLYAAIAAGDTGVAALLDDLRSDGELQLSRQLEANWTDLKDVMLSTTFEGDLAGTAQPPPGDTAAQRIVGALTAVSSTLSSVQLAQEANAHADLDRVQRDSSRALRNVLLIVGVALLTGVGAVLVLIRDVVPRLRSYSTFAREVAAGEMSGRLDARGADELSELGRVLDDLVVRRSDELGYAHAQAEFNEAMQVTFGEEEAHLLLKRHVERSTCGATATVLSRNNSANRLQPTTPLHDAPELVERLRNAQPRSCLAVRLGRAHDSQQGEESLLPCAVCGPSDGCVRCEPLLVGGEVIGSVLVQQQEQTDRDRRCISESVTIAAPILANLRNLALAEHRALSDALTGLPNQRACHDTVRRMIAQASRSLNPLAAVLLDLDHFKQINDVYGHDRGDEVLAAVGAVLASSTRASDFAGRYGGEEFLLLFAETSVEGAVAAAEKIRVSIAGIKVVGIDRGISASLGIAVMPDHAVDADGLLRQADRALYIAKAAGRNQTSIVDGAVGDQRASFPARSENGVTGVTTPEGHPVASD